MNRAIGLSLAIFIPLAACRPSSSADGDAPAAPAPHEGSTSYAKPSDDVLKAKLTPLQYEVTQHDATEPPFRNAYWNNHEPGIYVDVATGEPLFSSTDKFESGTGWPSFTKPIDKAHVVSKTDGTLGMERTEVRSKSGGSHLGHVFDDGPTELGGLRYCINSASLRFIPVSKLEGEGYGQYRSLFAAGTSPVSSALVTDTNNACAAPPPGTRAGCSTTLETAIASGDAHTADALAHVPGVLQIDRGTAHGANALRVVYDPKALTYARLLDAWSTASSKDGVAHHAVVAITPEQRKDADAWKMHASLPGLAVESADENAFVPQR